ncbi:MAG: RluA family pseudouridine synthase [Alphaproteobacteria bacterium]|nr:RluA family pseudouridine synthase [Alphaproteobacteria bacterium]
MNDELRREVRIGEDEAGFRLDKVLATRLPELSRARIQALIARGCLVDGRGAMVGEASRRVKPGEVYALTIPPPEPATPVGQAIPLAVVHEDDQVIVIDKPAGLVVHPAPGNPDRTLVNALIAHCGASLSGIGGERRPGIVHRIDKDTSGLMVIAKTDAAHAALATQFAAHTIERRYLALVWGEPVPSSGRIAGAIGRDPKDRKRMALRRIGGKPAATRYRVIATRPDKAISLVECVLETGRTHQIRVHLTSLGHPLVGDRIYGRGRQAGHRSDPALAAAAAFPRQALHATSLGFRHPKSGKTLRFQSKLSNDINILTRDLGLRPVASKIID